ncbi:DNA-binding protein [Agaribacterium haliotis]|uniref:DNA-binding protein n=1 Tax=Agaribacterium haliotis TaxID=2013869 RepID=UPI001178B1EE|nr:DNA-binding protein [Agaribacterium haliotis]
MPMFIRGLVKGVKSDTRVNRSTGEEKTTWKVGFEEPKPNGYDGEMIIRDVQITRSQLNEGLGAKYEKLIGQEVQAPVFCSPWSNGKGMTIFFADDGQPLGVK